MNQHQNTQNQELSLGVSEVAHNRPLIATKFFLKHGLRVGAIGCIVATSLSTALACNEPHLHQKTRSAGFLRDCGGQTPASVVSINSGCPNVQRGLVSSGSKVIFLQGVNRTFSGQRGFWYEVRVVQNQSTQNASANAREGAIGWLRANKF